jgi:hypothetical protein
LSSLFVICQFQSSIFKFLISSLFLLWKFFFNFVLQLQFLICFVFHFSSHFFNSYFVFIPFIVSILLNPSLFLVGVSEYILFVLIFYFGHFLFCLSFICLQFSISILICVYYIFQFSPSTFDFLFFPLVFFSKFL